MKITTSGNDSQQSNIPQQKKLSFYEENYILEPEDYQKDNGYFGYESDDTPDVIYFEDYQLAM